jgi:hypothetical protein
MSDASVNLEAILHAVYAENADRYAAALRLADDLAVACDRGEPIDDRLRQVFDLIGEAANREASLAALKQNGEGEGRRAGPDLRAVMDRIAGLIEELSRRLQTIERAARVRRDELAAQLDVCNRQRQMQRAYQRKS